MIGTAAWVARTEPSSIDVGLDPKEALVRARALIARLRKGVEAFAGIDLDVLHAAIEVIATDGVHDADGSLLDAERLHGFISASNSPESMIEEERELLQACSLWAWRLARRAGKAGLADEWARRASAGGSHLARDTTDPKAADPRVERWNLGRHSDESDTLLALRCELRKRWDTAPSLVLGEAELLYWHLERHQRPIGLRDEREYFLGEAALTAGTCCRLLSLREEALRWFDRADAAFRKTYTSKADRARVSYERLAIQTEEHRFDEVLKRLPSLVKTFNQFDMVVDVLKCRCIEGLARVEVGDLSLAATIFEQLRREAAVIQNDNLLAAALTNLVHVYGLVGDAENALACASQALPLLVRLGKRTHIGKVHWGIGSLLRANGQRESAIGAFSRARDEFAELGIAADVAATRLMIADLQLELGNDQAALREILLALPIVDEYKLIPEGVAALSLLRESVRQQKVNHQALRELHGFFEDSVS